MNRCVTWRRKPLNHKRKIPSKEQILKTLISKNVQKETPTDLSEYVSHKDIVDREKLIAMYSKEAEDNSTVVSPIHSLDSLSELLKHEIIKSKLSPIACFLPDRETGCQPLIPVWDRFTQIEECELFCENEFSSQVERNSKLAQFDCAITGVDFLVAETGVAVVLSDRPSGRIGSLITPYHWIIAHVSQIVPDLNTLFSISGITKCSALTLISGPSRTADIEKVIVYGVHGPLTVHVFLCDF